MIYIQNVFKDNNIRGFATIDTDNKETFWITYVDYELCLKCNQVILFENMPYPHNGVCDFIFGNIIQIIKE